MANKGSNAITEYAPGANGDVSPIATLSAPPPGYPPGLARPRRRGHLFVSNVNGPSVTEYAAAAKGNAAPLATLGGAATGLKEPTGLGFDAAGNLYVSDFQTRCSSSRPARAATLRPRM